MVMTQAFLLALTHIQYDHDPGLHTDIDQKKAKHIKYSPGSSVSDPDPDLHWIRIQQPQGSGSGIRIPNADPGSGSSSSILIFLVSTRSGFDSQTPLCSYTSLQISFSEDNIGFSSQV